MEQTFSTGDVIKGAGVTNHTLQSWLKRGLIVGHRNGEVEGGGSPGNRRRYAFDTLMELACAKAMQDATGGMDLPTTFTAAAQFAHYGDGDAEWTESDDRPAPSRLPSHPFHHHHGDTFLALSGDRAAVFLVPEGADTYATAKEALRGRATALVLVNLTALFCDVCWRLGLNPYDMMNAAYADEVARIREANP